MNRIFLYLGRFALIIVGYAAASLAASAFMHLLFLGSAGFRADETPMLLSGSLFSIPFVALFVAYFAFMPSIPAILLAEILGKRDWLFYALAGGAIGLVVFGFFWQAAGSMFDVSDAMGVSSEAVAGGDGLPNTYLALTMIACGMCGGMAYWLVAGRLAGNWRDTAGSTSPGPSGS